MNMGTGLVTLGATPTITASANNLTIGGVIDGPFGITKAGSGTLILSGLSNTAANNFSGNLTLDGGTTNITATANLAGGLVFGATNTSATVSTLNLTAASATFAGGLTAQTNSATASVIAIGTGQTLTVNGNTAIGSNAGSNTTTTLTVSGLGTLNFVNSTASATFFVGGSSATSGVGNVTTADFSGLSTLNITLGASSTIRVNPLITVTTDNVTGRKSIFRLAATSSLTATTLTVGGGTTFNSDATQINQLVLGSVANTINVNTFNVGTGGRDIGTVTFAGASGTVVIRARRRRPDRLQHGHRRRKHGDERSRQSREPRRSQRRHLVQHHEHRQPGRTGNLASTFTFDTGTLDATSVNIGFRTGTATATNTLSSTLNLGGGTVTLGNVAGSGAGVDVGNNANTGTGASNTNGTVNITGGNVTIYNSTALAPRFASARTTPPAKATSPRCSTSPAAT
ncbi:MAG: hypothetical protein QM775_12680 [Pirellulales bacterium]